jgi:glutamate racemase
VAIEPAIKPAAAMTQSGVVGVLATRQTLASASVAHLCATYGIRCRILLQPCPGLADQVDRGELDSPATRALLQQFLAPLQAAGADVVVLGCTHYPFLRPILQHMLGPGVTLLDPAAAVARELVRRLHLVDLTGDAQDHVLPGAMRLFASGPVAPVQQVVNLLWPEALAVESLS